MLTPQDKREIKDIVEKALAIGKDELMSTKQCAIWLGITDKALRLRCENHIIPFHKRHGSLYFSKNEVTNYYTCDRQ